jgi:hypothetical protein
VVALSRNKFLGTPLGAYSASEIRTMFRHYFNGAKRYSRAVGDPARLDPYAPNRSGIQIGTDLWSKGFVEQNENCPSCSTIKMTLAVPGTTLLRHALPQLAAVIGLQQESAFVPALNVGNVELLFQDYETNAGITPANKEMCRCVALQVACAMFNRRPIAQDQHGHLPGWLGLGGKTCRYRTFCFVGGKATVGLHGVEVDTLQAHHRGKRRQITLSNLMKFRRRNAYINITTVMEL